ncbi:hypothetical protein F2Q69_00045803 [Brassica cretica]|uniref:Uncharacterized protein n=1 Tax=Brassica cretica TaxID=69181 RepID=A0A8S9NSH5_BRACR|nr:hypothetical protein F2Q69_00045803 [Brassica cretica]
MHQKAPDYMKSKETILAIFGCFHIWKNKAPTTNLSKLQRFGDIINSAGSLLLHSTHQNTLNQPRPELPFSKSKAINSQQLFSHQAWNDFDHYFSNQNVPKKLSYSLKPSRYKVIIPALESRFME